LLIRLFKNSAAIFSSQIILTLGNLLLVPLFLKYWPVGLYGEWLALFSLVSYLTTLNLGMEMAVGNRLIQHYAQGNLEEYRRCQHSAVAYYLVIALSASVLLALISWNLPVASWLGMRETPAPVACWVMFLLGLQILWNMPLNLVVGVYRSMGNLSRSQWMSNIRELLGILFIAAVLMLGGGMTQVSLIRLTPAIIIVLYVLWDINRRYAVLTPGLSRASLMTVKELIRPGLLFVLFTFGTAISFQGPVIIISTVMGGAAVALFVTSRTLANLVHQMRATALVALWPEMTRIEALGKSDELRRLYRFLLALTAGLSIAFAGFLWHEGGEIISIWTGGKLKADVVLLKLLLIGIIIESPCHASGTLMAATNRHKNVAWLALSSSAVGLGIMALLITDMGTWSAPIGLMSGVVLFLTHFVVREACRLVGEPYGSFACRLWGRLLLTTAVVFLTGWIAHLAIPGYFLIRWAGVGSVTVIISFILTWTLWLTREDRMQLIARVCPLLSLAMNSRVAI